MNRHCASFATFLLVLLSHSSLGTEPTPEKLAIAAASTVAADSLPCSQHVASLPDMAPALAYAGLPFEFVSFNNAGGLKIPEGRVEMNYENTMSIFPLYFYYQHRGNRAHEVLLAAKRGILPVETAKASYSKNARKKLRRTLAEEQYRVVLDYRFDDVLEGCATVEHRIPKFETNADGVKTLAGWETNEDGSSKYDRSTWISPETRAIWQEGFRRGTYHSVGVFTPDGRLVSGSINQVHNGVFTSFTAFTAKDTDNAGHTEFLGMLLWADHQGFSDVDVRAILPGIGADLRGGYWMPVEQFVSEFLPRARAAGKVWGTMPTDGTGLDITDMVTAFVGPREG